MKERLFKFLLDQTFLYDFFINNILYKLFPKEKPEFYTEKIDKNNFLRKLYLIKDVFHKQLMYHDKIFYLNQEYISYEFSDYFYLSLLISDELDIINYNYDFNLIKSINKKNGASENTLKKAITSKIIIDLINNFKNIKDNEQKYEKELNEIEKENKGIIEENIKKFRINLNFDDIISMKIDDIYIKIIEPIIVSNKFELAEKIFLQLGLDAINIANIKFKELEEITKKEKYMISKIKDLFDKDKINYYYILVKYIFNTNSVINNINLFKSFQQFLIKIIKSQLYELYFNYIDNETIYEKRNYVIKLILNNEYYYQKYSEAIKLIELINYYKKCLSESKKEEIKSIEMMLKNNKININNKYEIEYSNFQIIKFMQKHKFKDLKEAKEKWMYINEQICNKALKDLEIYYVLLIKCNRDIFIKEAFIKIFPKDIIDYFNEEISIISLQFNEYKRICTFLFPSLQENIVSKEVFSYSINKKKNNFSEKIRFDSNDIIFEGKNIKKIIKYWAEKTDEKNNKIIKNSNELIKGLINWEQFFTKINEDFEIELEFIFKREKDLSNESFYNISYECYYITLNKIKKSNVPKELEKTKSTETIKYEKSRQLIATISNALNINDGMNIENIISKIGVPFKKEKIEIIKEKLPISPISFIFKGVKENNNIEEIKELNESLNLEINNRIQIDENLYALLTKEKDLIIHWNNRKKYKIIGYSIEITNNKLYMIQKSYQNNERVLLCCCKNQIKEKNGILFIEIDKKETETLINNITNFKVECMCLIYKSDDITRNNSNSKDKNNTNGNSNNNDFSKKDYFLLIGGIDVKENKSKVKLYKILTDGNNNEEKDQMKEKNIEGIRLSELHDDVLSQLEFESNIISINQKESEIIILTKENTYYLSFDIYGY